MTSLYFLMLCRIMVGLPSAENREMILKTLLAKEKHENLDFKELAAMTEGYSGSDLKVYFFIAIITYILFCGDMLLTLISLNRICASLQLIDLLGSYYSRRERRIW